MKRRLILFSAIASACMPMLADDPFPVEFHGYLRGGNARTSEGGEQVSFQLPGAGAKYRLGNEADKYGELVWDAKVYDKEGATFKVHTMANYYGSTLGGSGNISNGSGTVGIAQAWVEGTGILGDSEAFKSASLWAGRRYYNRNDVHIMDYFYWNNQGDGFGIENVNVGFGKFHYAYVQTDNTDKLPGSPVILTGQNITGSHDFRLSDIAIYPGGALNLGVEFKEAKPYSASSDKMNNNSGVEFIIQHVQSGVLGGDNKLNFQYGTGAGAALGNPNASLDSGNKAFRILDNLYVQPNTSFGMQAVLIYQQSKNPAGDKTTWTSIGGRPTFFLTKHFSVAVDVGMDTVKPPTGETLKLTKETLAFVWSPQPSFWSRPQIRAFVTNAQWNDSAQAAGLALAALPGNNNTSDPLGQGAFGTKTSGTTYGVQLEIWW